MRVAVDTSVCCGFGNCADACPEVFVIDERDGRARVAQDAPPTRLQAAVLRAATECPTGAIAVTDSEEASCAS